MRKRRHGRDHSADPVLVIVVGLASFSLGLLSVPQRPLEPSATAKTDLRALADGTDLGMRAWVGLNDPSIDQEALLVGRLAPSTRSVSGGAVRTAALQSKAGLARLAQSDGSRGY